jgi:hypothetical protein
MSNKDDTTSASAAAVNLILSIFLKGNVLKTNFLFTPRQEVVIKLLFGLMFKVRLGLCVCHTKRQQDVK